MGGKPNQGTPADRRLARNRPVGRGKGKRAMVMHPNAQTLGLDVGGVQVDTDGDQDAGPGVGNDDWDSDGV